MRRAALRRRRQVQANDAVVGTSLGAAMGPALPAYAGNGKVGAPQRRFPGAAQHTGTRVFPSFGTLELAASRKQTSDLRCGALQTRDPEEEERAGPRISGAAL